MKKVMKLLALVLVIALVGAAIGGTLAYLQDEDSAVNVMTLGSVYITQNEQQRVEKDDEFTSELEPFEQGKVLMPVTYPGNRTADDVTIGDYTITLSDDEDNYVDKIISVTNDGNSDAYVRTLVAVPTGGSDWEPTPVSANNCWLHWNIPTEYATYWTLDSIATLAEINGIGYYIWEFVHKEALESGKTTYPAVRGFYMDQKVNNDKEGFFMTYADGTTKRIDDFKSTDTVDILVLSQAVQTDGFANAQTALDTAFGKVADNAANWFSNIPRGYKVTGGEELSDAIEAGETELYLNSGTYEIPDAVTNKSLTINGTEEAIVDQSSGVITRTNADITFNGITVKGTTENYKGLQAGDVVYNNCVFDGGNHLYSESVTFNNCTFNLTSQYIITYGATEIIFNNCTFNTQGKAILVFQDGDSVDQVVTVKDCTFNATAAAYTYNGIHVAAVSIDGSANTTQGTFVVNFEGENIVDSNFAGLCQIKAQKSPANVTITGATPTELTYKQ